MGVSIPGRGQNYILVKWVGEHPTVSIGGLGVVMGTAYLGGNISKYWSDGLGYTPL